MGQLQRNIHSETQKCIISKLHKNDPERLLWKDYGRRYKEEVCVQTRKCYKLSPKKINARDC